MILTIIRKLKLQTHFTKIVNMEVCWIDLWFSSLILSREFFMDMILWMRSGSRLKCITMELEFLKSRSRKKVNYPILNLNFLNRPTQIPHQLTHFPTSNIPQKKSFSWADITRCTLASSLTSKLVNFKPWQKWPIFGTDPYFAASWSSKISH